MADPTRVDRMAVVAGIDALRTGLGRLFVVVGVFDGLHLGHLYLLGRLREEAARRDASPTVITFDHHPDEILTGAAPPLLCDADERLERLAAAGVEVTVVQHFDVALRMTEFDEFIRRIARGAPLAGHPHDPRIRRLVTNGEARPRPWPRSGPRWATTSRSSRPSSSTAGRSGAARSARTSPPATSPARPRLLGRPYAVVGEGRPAADGRVQLVVPDAGGTAPGRRLPGPDRVRAGSRSTLPGPKPPVRRRSTVAAAWPSRAWRPAAFRPTARAGGSSSRGRERRPERRPVTPAPFARSGSGCYHPSVKVEVDVIQSRSCRRTECRSRGKRSRRSSPSSPSRTATPAPRRSRSRSSPSGSRT